ncbi:NAD-dependent epimerase/dehydratase family protein [Streptomyces virginiae]|uniref:NAD-dependent epimerase/dehydratase family protein n=1 Tax=Streptomyces virginiae TaxID=1961 RepID=UPI0036EC797A
MGTLMVTGGAGFIGSHVVRHWRGTRPGDRASVVDAPTYAGNTAPLDDLRDDIACEHASTDDPVTISDRADNHAEHRSWWEPLLDRVPLDEAGRGGGRGGR